ncbi:MAG: hypothetical protein LBB72_07550 [Spirochaetaceae bacterium]|nr:hypothetical protein [Spirochaetaceae bacterium]
MKKDLAALFRTAPLPSYLAKIYKEKVGVKQLIESGWNLSEAEAEFGPGWLNAGVMDGDKREYPGKGTPQGGVISPLLSNLFLHEVMDDRFVKVVKPRMQGKASMVRYALPR